MRQSKARWRDLAMTIATAIVCVDGQMPCALAQASGVSEDRILFGQSAALSGPAASLGLGMREGIKTSFDEANRRGGVHGRELKLKTYDDAYEPDLAITNTNRLIASDDVFALVGAVGTPTSAAAAPIAEDDGVPFVGAFTGAALLRDPGLDMVVNIRASYDQEADEWIDYLTNDRGFSRIAILYQDDSFGRAGLAGVERAMELRELSLVAEGTYKRNTTAVKRALLEIRRAEPEAIVIVGAYEPTATFIKTAKSIGFDPEFLVISFVGSRALVRELGENAEGVLITQVVPPPTNTSVTLVNDFNQALAISNPDAEPSFVSLEGYLVGRFVIDVLNRVGPEPSREAFLATIDEIGEFELGGMRLDFGPGDNQGMDSIFLTIIRNDGSFEVVPRNRS